MLQIQLLVKLIEFICTLEKMKILTYRDWFAFSRR